MAPPAPETASQTAAGLRYLKAFEHFYGSSKDHKNGELLVLIAFGLYSRTEWKWAKDTGSPSEEDIAVFHKMVSTESFLKDFQSQAEETLSDFANAVVTDYQKKALKKSFLLGVLEAILGAFGYTLLLISLSVLAHLVGIDIFHYYEMLYGSK